MFGGIEMRTTIMRRLTILGSVAVAAVAVLAGAGPAATQGASSVELRAWLGAQGSVQRPGVGSGVFVANLQARRLTWSLAHRGVGTSVVAKLRVGTGAATRIAATLCAPCRTASHGRRVLSAATANALTTGRAYVDVQARGTAREIHGRVVAASAPTLHISSPEAGSTIDLPGEISYSVDGVTIESAPLHLEVYVAGADARAIDLVLDAPSGSVQLPDTKDAFLVGHHDVTFQLATAQLVPLPNPEAKVTVRDLTINGRRTGP
jgi:hypothetical protein